MKKFLRLTMVFIVLCSIICSSVVAADSDELYEKFGYEENFEYGDEYVAHALKSSVVCIILEYYATVEYTPVIFSKQALLDYINELYAEHSEYYTMEEIVDEVLYDMNENIINYLQWGEKKKLNVSLASQGSGVVVSEDGYIATNAHVVTLSDEDKERNCIEYLQSGIVEDILEVASSLEEIDVSLSEEQLSEIYDVVVEETEYRISNVKEKLYVCFPSASGDTNIEKDRIYEATVVEQGVAVNIGSEGATEDAAILSIDEDCLVAMRLSESYPESNSTIVTAGFPVVADTVFQSQGSTESVLSVSIGTGKVSRLVPIKGHDYKAMEITSTISGGNSGGPSVDKFLNIEGLNTYTSSEDSRYAYMIPAEYVSDLADDIDLEQGVVTKTFLTGLQMLQKGYGAAAVECFEYVQEEREDTPYIENLIELAEEAPQEYPPQAKSDKKVKYVIDYKLVAIIGSAAVVLVLIVVIIIVSVKKKRRKKKMIRDMAFRENIGQNPYAQSAQTNDKSEI